MILPKGDSLSSLGGDSLWSLDLDYNPRRKSLVDLISFIRTTGPKPTLPKIMKLSAEDASNAELTTHSSNDVSMTSSSPNYATERTSTSEWTSETTRNLLARIKQLREEPEPESLLAAASTVMLPSSPTSPASSPKTSTSSNSPPSTLSPASSRKSSWSSRRLNQSMRRDSFSSLFSSPGSLGLGSRLPKLDLKKRFKKQSNAEPSPPLSPLLSRSFKTRSRHVPLVGLGISGLDLINDQEEDRQSVREDSDATLRPTKSRPSISTQYFKREDSDATLRPTQRKGSSSSRIDDNLQVTTPSVEIQDGSTASSSRKTSHESDENVRPQMSRAQSVELLSSLPWNSERQKSRSPAELSTRSVSGILSPGFTLKRFRSITPLKGGNSSIGAGTPLNPLSRAQKKSFNSSFDFPAKGESFSFNYTDVTAKFRRARGNKDSQTLKAVKLSPKDVNNTGDAVAADTASSKVDLDAPSYESQLVDLRIKLGLPASKTFHTGPTHLSHPEHPYTWQHINLRCLVCPQPSATVEVSTSTSDNSHNSIHPQSNDAASLHPAMRPGFVSHPSFASQTRSSDLSTVATSSTTDADQSPTKTTNLENLTAVHPAFRARLQPLLMDSTGTSDEATTITSPAFTTTSPTTPRGPLTCALCPTTCCAYSSLLTQLSSPTTGQPLSSDQLKLFRELIRLTASGTPIGRSGARDSFSTFVRCSNEECDKTVCPGCASRCRLVGCGSVVCRVCREERKESGMEGWICGWHES